jgi:transcriptional antiterminator RfaH
MQSRRLSQYVITYNIEQFLFIADKYNSHSLEKLEQTFFFFATPHAGINMPSHFQSEFGKWYLVRCKPKQEALAVENLRRQGWICFNPEIIVTKYNNTQCTHKTEALFRGYIFIRGDDERINFEAVRSTRGVIGFVRFSLYPATVSHDVIDNIASNLLRSQQRISHQSEFASGTRVRVMSGNFEGMEAVYLCKSGIERSKILIRFLQGQQVEVRIDTRHLEKAVASQNVHSHISIS